MTEAVGGMDIVEWMAEEGRRAKRVAPEADQRVHRRLPVKSTDMAGGVAKFYKYLVNGWARGGP